MSLKLDHHGNVHLKTRPSASIQFPDKRTAMSGGIEISLDSDESLKHITISFRKNDKSPGGWLSRLLAPKINFDLAVQRTEGIAVAIRSGFPAALGIESRDIVSERYKDRRGQLLGGHAFKRLDFVPPIPREGVAAVLDSLRKNSHLLGMLDPAAQDPFVHSLDKLEQYFAKSKPVEPVAATAPAVRPVDPETEKQIAMTAPQLTAYLLEEEAPAASVAPPSNHVSAKIRQRINGNGPNGHNGNGHNGNGSHVAKVAAEKTRRAPAVRRKKDADPLRTAIFAGIDNVLARLYDPRAKKLPDMAELVHVALSQTRHALKPLLEANLSTPEGEAEEMRDAILQATYMTASECDLKHPDAGDAPQLAYDYVGAAIHEQSSKIEVVAHDSAKAKRAQLQEAMAGRANALVYKRNSSDPVGWKAADLLRQVLDHTVAQSVKYAKARQTQEKAKQRAFKKAQTEFRDRLENERSPVTGIVSSQAMAASAGR